MLNRWFLEEGKTERATLDYQGRLFLTLARLGPSAIWVGESKTRERFLVPSWSGQPACFLHYNGGGTWHGNARLEHVQQMIGSDPASRNRSSAEAISSRAHPRPAAAQERGQPPAKACSWSNGCCQRHRKAPYCRKRLRTVK